MSCILHRNTAWQAAHPRDSYLRVGRPVRLPAVIHVSCVQLRHQLGRRLHRPRPGGGARGAATAAAALTGSSKGQVLSE